MTLSDTRLTDLLGVELPLIQAPMAGANGADMAAAVSAAGGLGSLPCAMLDADRMRAEAGVIRQRTDRPFNMNFFCHTPAPPSPAAQRAWRRRLAAYYEEHDLDPDGEVRAPSREPFDDLACEVVEELRPGVVSFHFGLPSGDLLERVRAAGAKIIASATTVAEARWLEARGCDAVIAQGCEAGGHRGIFLSDDITSQAGTMALVPQIVDAVSVPVIAAGGIADGRGVAAALVLGAAGVQVGTAFLFTPEATISDLHRQALAAAADNSTALTNVFSGRPARGIVNRVMREVGPMAPEAPAFPTAGGALAPLKQAAEAQGRSDFSSLWSGQAAGLAQRADAGDLTRRLMADAMARLRAVS